MKKTNKMATVTMYNPHTRMDTHIERRVFEDERGEYFVRINGSYFAVDWLAQARHTSVDIWY